MSACLAAGLLLGWVASHLGPRIAAVRSDGTLVAIGPLARALDDQLKSPSAYPAPVKIGLTFLSTDRRYCRTFTTRIAGGASGVACHDAQGWRLRLLTSSVPRRRPGEVSPPMMQAPPELVAMVQQMISGDPLDTEAEEAARARGWRP
jgi:hypothetical protein